MRSALILAAHEPNDSPDHERRRRGRSGFSPIACAHCHELRLLRIETTPHSNGEMRIYECKGCGLLTITREAYWENGRYNRRYFQGEQAKKAAGYIPE
jgi:hypothetical protein